MFSSQFVLDFACAACLLCCIHNAGLMENFCQIPVCQRGWEMCVVSVIDHSSRGMDASPLELSPSSFSKVSSPPGMAQTECSFVM
jgi:hypothetical protein